MKNTKSGRKMRHSCMIQFTLIVWYGLHYQWNGYSEKDQCKMHCSNSNQPLQLRLLNTKAPVWNTYF